MVAAAAAAARSLAARSVHIKMHPTARSLPERREVLRVLERFGEVEMFRSLVYDPTSPVPNAFISILSSENAAQAAIAASPIRYRMLADPPNSSSSSSESTTPPSSPPSSATHTPEPNPSIFELRISPSPHPHAKDIASSPLHGPFNPVTPRRSPIAGDLAWRIPPSVAKPGLLDWETDSARARRRGGLTFRGGGGAGAAVAGGSSGGRSSGGGDEVVGGGVRGETNVKREGGQATATTSTMVQWGRGSGVGWDESKPWRLRDREREEREKRVPWAMRGLVGRKD